MFVKYIRILQCSSVGYTFAGFQSLLYPDLDTIPVIVLTYVDSICLLTGSHRDPPNYHQQSSFILLSSSAMFDV